MNGDEKIETTLRIKDTLVKITIFNLAIHTKDEFAGNLDILMSIESDEFKWWKPGARGKVTGAINEYQPPRRPIFHMPPAELISISIYQPPPARASL